MEPVELHPAFVWDCEECGLQNFELAIRVELSPEEMAEMREEQGIDPDWQGDWLSAPSEVTCRHCGKAFEALDDRADR